MKYYCTILVLLIACRSYAQENIYESPTLLIEKISERVYQHVSYLQTESFGLVACNGMIYMDENEAIVFDTPTDDASSDELIDWIVSQNRKVKAVIINHFHGDCLGGIQAFHKAGIDSYANQQTIALTKGVKPQIGFKDSMKLKIGNETVINSFFGEGHTQDNIVSYLSTEGVLFGGCMIKSLGAGKGNLADANVNEWSKTVTKILTSYPTIQIVIPGHGKYGDKNLLAYTIELFESPK